MQSDQEERLPRSRRSSGLLESTFDFLTEPSARKRSSDWENPIESSSSMELSTGADISSSQQSQQAVEPVEPVITPVERVSSLRFVELLQHAQLQPASWPHVAELLEWRLAQRLHEHEWKELMAKQAAADPTAGCSQALLSFNRAKNRYGNILPHDGTRFRLSMLADEEGSDYINASFVGTLSDTAGSAAFLACQAPLFRTFGDWYRMIWESKANVVIMLTGWEENHVTKADPYLPAIGSKMSFYSAGDISVEIVNQKHNSSAFTETTLLISKGHEDPRTIVHFHYLGWPDHGVPHECNSMLEMLAAVNQHRVPHCPQIVHCSAGVGRTGTWIAVSMLVDEIDNALAQHRLPQLNIMKSVDLMRSYRHGMVQQMDQYTFIYNAVLTYLRSVLPQATAASLPVSTVATPRDPETTASTTVDRLDGASPIIVPRVHAGDESEDESDEDTAVSDDDRDPPAAPRVGLASSVSGSGINLRMSGMLPNLNKPTPSSSIEFRPDETVEDEDELDNRLRGFSASSTEPPAVLASLLLAATSPRGTPSSSSSALPSATATTSAAAAALPPAPSTPTPPASAAGVAPLPVAASRPASSMSPGAAAVSGRPGAAATVSSAPPSPAARGSWSRSSSTVSRPASTGPGRVSTPASAASRRLPSAAGGRVVGSASASNVAARTPLASVAAAVASSSPRRPPLPLRAPPSRAPLAASRASLTSPSSARTVVASQSARTVPSSLASTPRPASSVSGQSTPVSAIASKPGPPASFAGGGGSSTARSSGTGGSRLTTPTASSLARAATARSEQASAAASAAPRWRPASVSSSSSSKPSATTSRPTSASSLTRPAAAAAPLASPPPARAAANTKPGGVRSTGRDRAPLARSKSVPPARATATSGASASAARAARVAPKHPASAAPRLGAARSNRATRR